MCINYHELNKVTTKNPYPLSGIDDLFDQLQRTNYFSNIDLRSSYHQICVKEGDVEKTTFRSHYIKYEYVCCHLALLILRYCL